MANTNRMVTRAAISSAMTMEPHMPSIPQIRGKMRTAAIWKTMVLRKACHVVQLQVVE